MGVFELITSGKENEPILQVFFSVKVILACQKRLFFGIRWDDKHVAGENDISFEEKSEQTVKISNFPSDLQ